jgi:hypothetical protein
MEEWKNTIKIRKTSIISRFATNLTLLPPSMLGDGLYFSIFLIEFQMKDHGAIDLQRVI